MEKTAKLSDDQVLEAAYRTIAAWLGESINLLSQTVLRFKEPDALTALELKRTVDEYDGEIKRFNDALAGRIKPRFHVVEPPLEKHNIQKVKVIEESRRKEAEIVRKGIAILKQRRHIYINKLRMAKMRQFQVGAILTQAESINKQAQQILGEIEKHRVEIKNHVQKFIELQAKRNGLCENFKKINLDPAKVFQR